jgi:ABC-type transporter lipoprotein component MlaA
MTVGSVNYARLRQRYAAFGSKIGNYEFVPFLGERDARDKQE